MMMPRKKRRTILIVSIILLLLIIAVTLILLYINTDMFKSSATLFTKYIGQNVENLETFYSEVGKNEYNELLKQNKYTTDTQVKVNYTKNIGTSSESTQNSINQLKLEISGQTDNNNQYNYQDINLLNNTDKVAEVEYIQNANTYGIKFSDVFNQYILANNENLKQLFQKLDYSEEEIAKIPDKIEFNNEIETIFQFSEEEKQQLQNKYIGIINNNVSKESFSKQKNQLIQIDGKNIKANSYTLALTKEQLNNIFIKILEEIKQDEILLSKMDNIQSLLEKYQIIDTTNLREDFSDQIENLITDITKNNIGQDEAKIIVYENNQTTISTMVQTPDYEMYVDLLSLSTENYIQISFKSMITGKEQVFTYKQEGEETNISSKNTQDGETKEYSLAISEKIDDNDTTKNIIAKYEDASNRVEATIEQKINMVDGFENEVVLGEENAINLSELEAEQVKMIREQVNAGVSEKINAITGIVKLEDIEEILKVIGVMKEEEVLEAMGVTETERNRFNSKFEILQGENIESAAVLNLIEAVKENLIGIEVVSDTELKLQLDQFNKNEEVATTLSSFIEQRKDKKYNAKVEYDETTGLVTNILLTMMDKR